MSLSTGQREAEAGLDTCDGYVVVVVDPRVDELDAYGPFDGFEATIDAVRRRDELDREELTDVVVSVVRLHKRPAHHPSVAAM